MSPAEERRRQEWEDLSRQLRKGPDFGIEILSSIKNNLEEARHVGPEAYCQFLNRLSGIGIFGVKGTILVPSYTRAFGDFVLNPGPRNPYINREERVSTKDDDPYFVGRVAYLMRSAWIAEGGTAVVEAEENVEDGEPRLMIPDNLDRFELIRLIPVDVLERRSQKYAENILRLLGREFD